MAMGVFSFVFWVGLAITVIPTVLACIRFVWAWIRYWVVYYNPPTYLRRMVEEYLKIQFSEPPEEEPPIDLGKPKEAAPVEVEQQCKCWDFNWRYILERLEEFEFPGTLRIISIVIGGIAGLMLIWAVYLLLRKRCGRTIMRMRGVQFESMRDGSHFVKGSIPRYQVAVKQPGIWGDSHIGYGIRHGNFLIMPKHVYLDVGDNILLEGRKKKAMPTPSMIQSRIVQDLVYIWLPEKIWVSLGTASATLSKTATFPLVTCAGLEGVSSGMLRKSQTKGIVVYNGSTLPGMSGASYDAGCCYGLHIGAAGQHNIGVSSVALRIELKHLVVPESSEDVAERYIEGAPIRMKSGQTWTEHMLMEMADRNWTEDSWVNEPEIDYDGIVDFGEESRKKKKAVPTVTLDGVKLDFSGQSDSNSDQVMECVSNRLVEKVKEHDQKIKQLEKAVVDLQIKGSEKYPCDKCKTICRSQEKLDAHYANAHSVSAERVYHNCECGNRILKKNLLKHQERCQKGIPLVDIPTTHVGESAVPGDEQTLVNQAPFLERRSNLQRRIGKSSRVNSRLSVRNHPSQVLVDALLDLKESQKLIVQLLKEQRKPMDGQNLEGKQSSSH